MKPPMSVQAAKLKAWLDADPDQAVEIINAGLAMLAVHGFVPGSGRPLERVSARLTPILRNSPRNSPLACTAAAGGASTLRAWSPQSQAPQGFAPPPRTRPTTPDILLAMQKVEGSSPFSRLQRNPRKTRVSAAPRRRKRHRQQPRRCPQMGHI